MSKLKVKNVARDCLAALFRKTSMIKVKIALRERLRSDPDLVDAFTALFRETHVKEFEARLNEIAETGVAPAYRHPSPRRPAVTLPPGAVTALVAEIRRRFHYDEHTGELVWRPGHKGKRPGSLAGTVNTKGTMQVVIHGTRYAASYICWLHYYGEEPGGKVRMRRNSSTLAIKNLYVLEASR